MDEDQPKKRNRLLVAGLVTVVFLVVVAVQILWQQAEEEAGSDLKGPEIELSSIKIQGEEGEVEIDADPADFSSRREQLRAREVKRQVELLSQGDARERWVAAFRLAFIADETAEGALLKGLKDKDPKVTSACATALLKLWRQPKSPAVSRVLQRGLTAYELGNLEEALAIFDETEKLDPAVAELYRLRGEIHLSNSDADKAMVDARHAIKLKPQHFRAYQLLAQCYVKKRNTQKALENVEKALTIYPHSQEALRIKKDLEAELKS